MTRLAPSSTHYAQAAHTFRQIFAEEMSIPFRYAEIIMRWDQEFNGRPLPPFPYGSDNGFQPRPLQPTSSGHSNITRYDVMCHLVACGFSQEEANQSFWFATMFLMQNTSITRHAALAETEGIRLLALEERGIPNQSQNPWILPSADFMERLRMLWGQYDDADLFTRRGREQPGFFRIGESIYNRMYINRDSRTEFQSAHGRQPSFAQAVDALVASGNRDENVDWHPRPAASSSSSTTQTEESSNRDGQDERMTED